MKDQKDITLKLLARKGMEIALNTAHSSLKPFVASTENNATVNKMKNTGNNTGGAGQSSNRQGRSTNGRTEHGSLRPFIPKPPPAQATGTATAQAGTTKKGK